MDVDVIQHYKNDYIIDFDNNFSVVCGHAHPQSNICQQQQ